MARPISDIARDVYKAWPNVNFAAKPYLEAMLSLGSIDENYYFDSGRSVVMYFLSNAHSFRGDEAKALRPN